MFSYSAIWARTDSYVGKILHIKASQALSVQYHNVKDETVYLLSGELIYRIWEGDGDDKRPRDVGLKIGEAFRITPGTIHQMEAVTDCDILEVSTPHLDTFFAVGANSSAGASLPGAASFVKRERGFGRTRISRRSQCSRSPGNRSSTT